MLGIIKERLAEFGMEKVARIGVGTGVGLALGSWTLADIGEVARIIASLCAAGASVAAGWFYIRKAMEKKS